MNPPDLYGANNRPWASRQGVPPVVVALAVITAFLLGLHFGGDSAVPPAPAAATEPAPVQSPTTVAFDPATVARLDACQAEKQLLMAALARGPGSSGGGSDFTSHLSSGGGSSGGSTSWRNGGDELAIAEVQTGQARVQILGDGSEVRVYGQVDNQSLQLVQGSLQVILVNKRGGAVAQRLLVMTLESGLTSFDVVFSRLPKNQYSARLIWKSDPD